MKLRILTALLVYFVSSLQARQPYVSQVWSPDLGNGQYKNPVIFADYSDWDVCRAGDDYYLTASSFGCVPGYTPGPAAAAESTVY